MTYINIRKDTQFDETGSVRIVWGMSGTETPIDGRPWQYLAVLAPGKVLDDGKQKYLFGLWGQTELVKINFSESLFEQHRLQPIEPLFLEVDLVTDEIESVADKIGEVLEKSKNHDYQLDVFELERELSNIIPVTIKRQWHL